MSKLNVAVLMGGKTAEHEISLKSGEVIIANLDKDKYRVKPVKIKKTGEWIVPEGFIENILPGEGKLSLIDSRGENHNMDISEDNWPVSPEKCSIQSLKNSENDNIDVVFIALHGPYGEDGTVQGLLEMMNIPYTGSDVLSSAIAMNKAKCKEVYIYNKINVPDFIACNYYEWNKKQKELIDKTEEKLGYPCVVKPANLGSSVGTYIVKDRDELAEKVSMAFEYDKTVLMEEYLKGTEVTCAVLGGKAGEEPVAFPLTEIVPPDDVEFFDYDVKYNGRTREITPARISPELTSKCQEIAVKVHKILGCGGTSRTDMIIIDDNIYVLETNTIPGMTKQSLYPQAAASVGIEFPDLLDKIIELAMDAFKNKKIKTEWK